MIKCIVPIFILLPILGVAQSTYLDVFQDILTTDTTNSLNDLREYVARKDTIYVYEADSSKYIDLTTTLDTLSNVVVLSSQSMKEMLMHKQKIRAFTLYTNFDSDARFGTGITIIRSSYLLNNNSIEEYRLYVYQIQYVYSESDKIEIARVSYFDF